jgi:hypothetical protein
LIDTQNFPGCLDVEPGKVPFHVVQFLRSDPVTGSTKQLVNGHDIELWQAD